MFKVKLNSGAFLINFEHISHVFLVLLLLTLNKSMLPGEHVRLNLLLDF